MPKNPFIIKPANSSGFSKPENQSAGILDDYAVRKNVATREGTIEKVPINNSDIVNKKYCDANISGLIGAYLNLSGSNANQNINIGIYNLTTTGDLSANQLISTVLTGTSPLSVLSTTKATNLNADYLDGLHSSSFVTTEADPVAMAYLDQAVKTTSSPSFVKVTAPEVLAGTSPNTVTLKSIIGIPSITSQGANNLVIASNSGSIGFSTSNLATTGTITAGNNADAVNLTLNGKVSQTASYLKVLNSSAATLFEVDDEGRIGIRGAADYRYSLYHNVTETLGDVSAIDLNFTHTITCNTNNARSHQGMNFTQYFDGSGNFTRTGGGGGAEGIVCFQQFYGTGTISEATGLALAYGSGSSNITTEYKYLTLGSTYLQDTASIGTIWGLNILTLKSTGGSGVTTAYAIQAQDGLVIFNEAGTSYSDVRIEGDTDANLLFTDASADKVGIGMNNPAYKLDVTGDINVIGTSAYRIGGTAGISATITTARLTPVTGSQGSMTFVKGILTAQTQAT